jgi:hypothetical protein
MDAKVKKVDIFKPIEEGGNNKELLNIQEFKRENVREQFKEIEQNKDFFAFVSEDDPKYDYLKIRHMFNSKLMFQALIWSNVISAAFTLHRYSRIHNLKKSIASGSKLFILCFMPIWGSLELRPHLVMWYYTKFLDRLSYEKQLQYNSMHYIENLKVEHEKIEQQLGVRVPITEKQTIAIILSQFNYENFILKIFNYRQMNLDAFIKEKDQLEVYADDFNENELFSKDEEEEKIDYDFSIINNRPGELCHVTLAKFLELEKLDTKFQVGRDKLHIIRNDVLHKGNKKSLTEAIKKAEKFLNKKEDHFDDLDYLKII